MQSHTSTLTQEGEGLQLLTGSSSSSVIRERSKAALQQHLGSNCQAAKAAMWAAAAARNLNFPVSVSCFSPIIISLSEGVANLDSPVQVSLPFWAPSGCREVCTAVAGPWELCLPAEAAGGQVGEQRTSQKPSHTHVRQLTQGKLKEIPTDAWI